MNCFITFFAGIFVAFLSMFIIAKVLISKRKNKVDNDESQKK